MPTDYINNVAPWPAHEHDVTATDLARHLACTIHSDLTGIAGHYYLAGPWGDRQGARDFALLSSRVAGHYGTLLLLRALIEAAPGRADEVATQLWHDWASAESVIEWIHEWLAGYGIDPGRVAVEAPTWERITVEVAT